MQLKFKDYKKGKKEIYKLRVSQKNVIDKFVN